MWARPGTMLEIDEAVGGQLRKQKVVNFAVATLSCVQAVGASSQRDSFDIMPPMSFSRLWFQILFTSQVWRNSNRPQYSLHAYLGPDIALCNPSISPVSMSFFPRYLFCVTASTPNLKPEP